MKLIPRIIKCIYYITILSAFCSNMIVVSHTTALSVLGAGMALRGPDGSMMTATDGLYEERKTVFFIFGVGLGCTVSSVVLCVLILLPWESAICCMIISLLTCRAIWRNYKRVSQRFDFDENDTVDFRDIMEGPAAIQAVPLLKRALNGVTMGGSTTRRGGGPTTTTVQKSHSQYNGSNHHDNDEPTWRQPPPQSLVSRNTSRSGRPNSPRDEFIQTV
jgi:hypothetical protein